LKRTTFLTNFSFSSSISTWIFTQSNDSGPRGGLRALLLSQSIALLIACTGIFATELVNDGILLPTFQSFLVYIFLALLYVPFRLFRNGTKPLQTNWWKYFLLALCDVEANYVVVLAYQYTSVANIMLLDCLTIPFVMVLSYFFLGARFSIQHIVGVITCIFGLSILISADAAGVGSITVGSNKNVLFGDLLCIIASGLYAISNVGQEICVRSLDRIEFLAALGLFGSIINGIQAISTEYTTLLSTTFTNTAKGNLAGFVISLFSMYSLTSVFLAHCGDATLFNLGLLASDIWAIFASYFLFSQPLSGYYFLSLFLTVGGVVIYNRAPEAVPDRGTRLLDDTSMSTNQEINNVKNNERVEQKEKKEEEEEIGLG